MKLYCIEVETSISTSKCRSRKGWKVATPSGGVQVSQGVSHEWGEQGICARVCFCDKFKNQAVNFLVEPHSYPHVYKLWVLTKRVRSHIHAADVSALSLRDVGGAQSRASWRCSASDQDASWFRGYVILGGDPEAEPRHIGLGMPHWLWWLGSEKSSPQELDQLNDKKNNNCFFKCKNGWMILYKDVD